MQITERCAGSAVIVTLNGRLVFDARKIFQQAMKNARGKGPEHLVINLEKVTFIDSAGLGLLALAFEECKVHNRQCSLIRPEGRMNDLIELTRFPEIVPTFRSEQEALQASPALTKG